MCKEYVVGIEDTQYVYEAKVFFLNEHCPLILHHVYFLVCFTLQPALYAYVLFY